MSLRFISKKFAAALVTLALLAAAGSRAFPQPSGTEQNAENEKLEPGENERWYDGVRNEIVEEYEAAATEPPMQIAYPRPTWLLPAVGVMLSGVVTATVTTVAAQKKKCNSGRLGCGNVLSPTQ